ncbi:MAG: oxidoreductase alpha (molybdopterin) subunit [Phycisphaerales bacterium]|nr:oxidoreductase alpha (molybdopterin) subunit [Phycisphaerales bacterium]
MADDRTPGTTRENMPQHQGTPADHADNAQSGTNNNRWNTEKKDVRSACDLHDGAAPGAHPGHAAEVPGQVPLERPHGRVSAETSEAFTGLRLTERHHKAAGMPAVLKATEYVFKHAGPVRGSYGLSVLNQKGGIDCMSCAWPEPDGARPLAEFCENGAKALGHEMDTKRCGPDFFAAHSVAELSTRSDYWLEHQGRLTHPMVLRTGATHYELIAWDDAYKLIAGELNALASPNEAAFYTSGRASNEAAFVYQLFVRRYGTNNMPDCSNMCHESSGTALSATLGVGKGTVQLDDFEKAQLILIVGQNPGTNHPRMLTTLQKAKRAGADIVAVNPLPEAGLLGFMNPQEPLGLLGKATPLADEFVPVKINGDVAFFKGVMKELLHAEEQQNGSGFDWAYIKAHTHGVEPLIADLQSASWDRIVEDSGVGREQIRAVADRVKKAERIIACWAMGLTQQRDGVEAIQEVVNLLLLRGSMGKPGAGACPVRGHSNVQGDRTMGIWERPQPVLLDAIQKNFGFDPPREHGFDAVETIKAMHAGKVKVFVQLGGNFLSAAPDTLYVQEGLSRLNLSVRIGTKLNRADLVTGKQSLILPCLGRSEHDRQKSGEQFITTENSMSVVEQSRGRFEPASPELRSETAILCGIAKATVGPTNPVDWDAWAGNYDLIRDAIANTIDGCQDYNAKVRKPGGFHLPNLARQNEFVTDTGKANFTVNKIPDRHLEPGQLVMMTIRSHDQFNTTIYELNDRYRGVHNERRVIFMNRQDMADRGLEPRRVVDITGHHEGHQRHAPHFIVVPYDIPRGCCATYYPEGNVLVPINSVANRSNQPASKYVPVTVAPAVGAHRFDYDKVDGGLLTPTGGSTAAAAAGV